MKKLVSKSCNIILLQIGECRFQSTNSRWSVNLEGTKDVECNNEEFCLAAANLDRSDCEYTLKQLREDGFGAEVFGLSLGYNEISITSIQNELFYTYNGNGLMHICKSSSKILESYPAIVQINLSKMQSCTGSLFSVTKKK